MARILVVDDERFIRNTIKDILEHEKYIVDLAEDATQAFEKTKSKHYDLILTDIVMPGISGIVLLEKLKEDGFESPIMIMWLMAISRLPLNVSRKVLLIFSKNHLI